VDAEKASHNHISFGIFGNDLQAKLQGMLHLEWGRFHGAQRTKMLDPIEETLQPIVVCV
jgi:hypothetical protein